MQVTVDAPDAVICTSDYSREAPYTGGQVVFAVTDDRSAFLCIVTVLTHRAVFKGEGYGFNPPPEIVTKNDLSFSQCFPHISSVVVQCRSVYANF